MFGCRRGERRAALVAPRDRQAGGRGHVRLLDRACRARCRHRGALRRMDRQHISPAIPECSISRPSAARSSRRICASPTNGRIFMVRAGSKRWSVFTRTATGIFTTTTAARAIASCCSGRTARATDIRRGFGRRIRRMPGVTSVQITFHEDRDPDRHAMPPGGFRLAIVNGFDLGKRWPRASGSRNIFCRSPDNSGPGPARSGRPPLAPCNTEPIVSGLPTKSRSFAQICASACALSPCFASRRRKHARKIRSRSASASDWRFCRST